MCKSGEYCNFIAIRQARWFASTLPRAGWRQDRQCIIDRCYLLRIPACGRKFGHATMSKSLKSNPHRSNARSVNGLRKSKTRRRSDQPKTKEALRGPCSTHLAGVKHEDDFTTSLEPLPPLAPKKPAAVHSESYRIRSPRRE